MGLQIEVTGPVLEYAGEQYHDKLVNVKYYLKFSKQGDNPEVDTRVIGDTEDGKGMPFSGQCKTEVEGKTLDELVTRVEQVAIKLMQTEINIYNKLQNVAIKPRVIQSPTNIQNGLEG